MMDATFELELALCHVTACLSAIRCKRERNMEVDRIGNERFE